MGSGRGGDLWKHRVGVGWSHCVTRVLRIEVRARRGDACWQLLHVAFPGIRDALLPCAHARSCGGRGLALGGPYPEGVIVVVPWKASTLSRLWGLTYLRHGLAFARQADLSSRGCAGTFWHSCQLGLDVLQEGFLLDLQDR